MLMILFIFPNVGDDAIGTVNIFLALVTMVLVLFMFLDAVGDDANYWYSSMLKIL